jgi:hypothetical protein
MRRENYAGLDVLCAKVSSLHHRALLQDDGELLGDERPLGLPGSVFLLSAGPPWCVCVVLGLLPKPTHVHSVLTHRQSGSLRCESVQGPAGPSKRGARDDHVRGEPCPSRLRRRRVCPGLQIGEGRWDIHRRYDRGEFRRDGDCLAVGDWVGS